MKMKRRSFIKGLLGALSAPSVLKAGGSDISVLTAKNTIKTTPPKMVPLIMCCTTSEYVSKTGEVIRLEENWNYLRR